MKLYNYVYKITNLISGKIYVGKHSTNNLDDGYMGSGKILGYAKKKYGIENFTKEYLFFTDNEESLNYFEKYYIRKYNSQDPLVEYNLTAGGDGTVGYQFTEETKKKMSEDRKGENNPMYGKHFSDETKKKMSEAKKGINWMKGEKNPFYGKKHSPETIAKMKEAHKGLIAWNKGKKGIFSDEVCKRISEANRGKHWYNNGEKNVFVYECPEGYVPGRLKKQK